MQSKRFLPRRWPALLVACALLPAVPLAALAASQTDHPANLQQTLNLLQQESKARAEVVKQVSPAVVNITVESHATQEDAGQMQLPDP
ncbi:MAG TPA: hypothetical protein VL359_08285, partial [bacterium]|nr:hypothetical protein [bacterium]